jgi:hypothetical protein
MLEREVNVSWMPAWCTRKLRVKMFTSVTIMLTIGTLLRSIMEQNALARFFDHVRSMSDDGFDD